MLSMSLAFVIMIRIMSEALCTATLNNEDESISRSFASECFCTPPHEHFLDGWFHRPFLANTNDERTQRTLLTVLPCRFHLFLSLSGFSFCFCFYPPLRLCGKNNRALFVIRAPDNLAQQLHLDYLHAARHEFVPFVYMLNTNKEKHTHTPLRRPQLPVSLVSTRLGQRTNATDWFRYEPGPDCAQNQFQNVAPHLQRSVTSWLDVIIYWNMKRKKKKKSECMAE